MPSSTTAERDEREEATGGEATELSADDFGKTEQEDWANGTEGDDFDGIRELPSSAGVGEGEDNRPLSH